MDIRRLAAALLKAFIWTQVLHPERNRPPQYQSISPGSPMPGDAIDERSSRMTGTKSPVGGLAPTGPGKESSVELRPEESFEKEMEIQFRCGSRVFRSVLARHCGIHQVSKTGLTGIRPDGFVEMLLAALEVDSRDGDGWSATIRPRSCFLASDWIDIKLELRLKGKPLDELDAEQARAVRRWFTASVKKLQDELDAEADRRSKATKELVKRATPTIIWILVAATILFSFVSFITWFFKIKF